MEERKIRRRNKKRYWTGEDIDMFRENQYSRKSSNENICDKHIDGA